MFAALGSMDILNPIPPEPDAREEGASAPDGWDSIAALTGGEPPERFEESGASERSSPSTRSSTPSPDEVCANSSSVLPRSRLSSPPSGTPTVGPRPRVPGFGDPDREFRVSACTTAARAHHGGKLEPQRARARARSLPSRGA